MTLRELMLIITDICPDAMFDEGDDGEVVIYTGCAIHPNDNWEAGMLPVLPVRE